MSGEDDAEEAGDAGGSVDQARGTDAGEGDHADETGDGEPAEPLGDLAERARRGRDAASAGEELLDAFEAVDVEAVDEDRLWEELESGSVEGTVEAPRTEAERRVEEVSKRQYCQRCRFFSEPPEVRCTHEDGDVLEVVDAETFRVADCPVLAGEEELEQLGK